MKKLLFLVIITFLLSCEKEPSNCWVCKIDSITTIQGIVVGTMSTLSHPCGITTEDIFGYEEAGTRTVTIDLLQSGYIAIKDVTTTSKVNCKRK